MYRYRVARMRMIASALSGLLFALFATFATCQAQTANSTALAAIGKDATAAIPTKAPSSDKANAPADPADPQTGHSGTAPQTGANKLTDRFKTFNRYAPYRESWTTLDLGTKYFRAVVGGLEQGASLGVGLQATTADMFRFVEFRATAITSVKLYRRFEGEAYFPKVFDSNTHADLYFDYLRRTKDNFFGIGPTTPESLRTNYDIERRSVNGTLSHEFSHEVVIGGYFSISNAATYKGQDDSITSIDQIFSGDPNTIPVSAWAPGLHTNVRTLSFGGFAEVDLRNNNVGLTKGAYFYGRFGSVEGLKNQEAFADFGWIEAELDARGYIPLFSNKTSLALRGYSVLKDPRGGSQIPFYDLAFYGGRMYGRGFRDYRFRGNNMVLGSAELRQTVWTMREDRGVDVFAFGDGGQVWGDNRSNTAPIVLAHEDFSSRNWRAGMGGGAQFRYSRSLAARIEIGHTNERNAFYFSISRGF